MRKKIVAGNWKLNNDIAASKALAANLKSVVGSSLPEGVSVVVCPTSINITTVVNELEGSPIEVGAQNCYSKSTGAFTGEVSAEMVASAGAKHVILGHSERREYFAESDEFLAEKTKAVLAAGLTPIFCCGETLEQREAGVHFDFVKSQLTNGLFDLSEADFKKVVIAYEPIWAIGTGVTASSDQAQEMHKELRDHLASKYGADVANDTSLLYGGSCKPGNAPELFACADIDGGLIGGAALNAEDFNGIITAF